MLLSEEDAKILYASENVKKVTPFRQAEVLGKKLVDFVVPEDRAKVRHFLSRERSHLPPADDLFAHRPARGERLLFHFRLELGDWRKRNEEKNSENQGDGGDEEEFDGEFNHFSLMGHYQRMRRKSL